MFPVITYDVETCNDYSFNQFKGRSNNFVKNFITNNSSVLEISLLFVKSFNSKPKFLKIKTIYPKSYNDSSDYEKQGLGFYFLHQLGRKLERDQNVFEVISEQEIIQMLLEHNKQAKSIESMISKVIRFVSVFVGEINFKLNSTSFFNYFTLLGKNNKGFDDYILFKLIKQFYPECLLDFISNSWDIQKFIFEQKDSHTLDTKLKLKYFRFMGEPKYDDQGNFISSVGAYTLSNIYMNLFHDKLEGAHDSKFDVIATFRIFSLYYRLFPSLVKSSCQVGNIDLFEEKIEVLS